MLVALSAVLVFVAVVILLVALLNTAANKLLPQGKVAITINDNDENTLSVNAGRSLLSTLSDEKIFIPSACGGGGTCGMCKCRITEGGGQVLPTELNHISRSEVKQDIRLSCQVKVREPMKIYLPEEIFSIRQWECTVRSNRSVATFIKELVLELPEKENLEFKAGGYIQIDIPEYPDILFSELKIAEEYRNDWDKYNMWQLVSRNEEETFRAYSMANHPAEGNVIMLNVRIATPPPSLMDSAPPGVGSSYIFNLKPGDRVRVSGPYGEFFIRDSEREMVYIGGGAGMAPMRSHIFHLFKTLKTGRKVSFWYGARSRKEMFYDDEFRAIADAFPNFTYHVSLSNPLAGDNWNGFTGFIHTVLYENYLKDHEEPEEIEYYMCGPPVMVSSVETMLYNLGVEKEMISYDEFS
ncbi:MULTISPECIES: NADH:ubiquinone reductase (Na(+)-transporting) subunit F [Prosthecochloris]|uniref:Na(+)-translocating NADH-quinone reductase subunit F n=1 Tax=Prosthecochloris marina TaxID=2017681 RepID=A0A317T8G7_9CHLB|nr:MULTISPECIES: NADH:ubiquinone reductase (Na(+)-transporting) subunit F [Prosthecochloris]PWW82875.1 NADH:ubiquinone reductase (Na(+)-transporting) subunit F [Prosthecochloris marina]UZJ37832.1 NADH:ubiquinone reductase (Na(+)-transporting) subunit F [Prosthecochloris sp. SCSIO W1103]UZJ41634.1 NADH:ubiquinone reductase (Na(+)-transporting) subunit F [Prosthecochloris sp. SCSIO W1101]